jgi:plastocyanin
MAMALPATMRTLATAIFGLALAACTVGGVGQGDDVTPPPPPGDDNPPPPPPDPTVDVGMSPSTITGELGSIDNNFTVTVTGSGGFSGPVALAYSGIPSDWNAAFDTDTVTLTENGTATATLNVRVPTNATATTASISISATSTAAPASVPTPSSLEILNQVTIHIAAGTGSDSGNHNFGMTEVRVKAGATIRIQNDDGIPHRIHGDNLFPHEDDNDPGANPGGVYAVPMTDTGLGDFYCHDHGGNPVNVIVE